MRYCRCVVSSQKPSSSNDGAAVKKPSALPMFGRIKTSAIAKPTPKETPVSDSMLRFQHISSWYHQLVQVTPSRKTLASSP